MSYEIIFIAIFLGAIAGIITGVYDYNIKNVFTPVTEQQLDCGSIIINDYFVNKLTEDEQKYLVELCSNTTKAGVNKKK